MLTKGHNTKYDQEKILTIESVLPPLSNLYANPSASPT
jgi:hypothetical protein